MRSPTIHNITSFCFTQYSVHRIGELDPIQPPQYLYSFAFSQYSVEAMNEKFTTDPKRPPSTFYRLNILHNNDNNNSQGEFNILLILHNNEVLDDVTPFYWALVRNRGETVPPLVSFLGHHCLE